MSDVFISYSRKDIAFARLIQESLQKSDIDTWIDWERIPVGERWWEEIRSAIEHANVFMFIISSNSIGSKVCKDEIDQALQNHKRIIPIIVDALGPEVIQECIPELPQFNWIIFERDHIFQLQENTDGKAEGGEDHQVALPKLPQFKEALEKLSQTIHTDWDWVKYHTRLQVDALRWESSQKNASYLIRGTELEEAEQRLFRAAGKEPQPTILQVEYVTASRQDETLRQQERLALEQKSRQRQRFALWAVGGGLLLAIVLGVIAWSQRNQFLNETHVRSTAQAQAVTAQSQAVGEANARATQEAIAVQQKNEAVLQARKALSGKLNTETAMLLGKQNDLALLLAIEGYNYFPGPQSRGTLLNALLTSSRLVHELHGTQDTVESVAYSSDGSMIATDGCGHLDESFVCHGSETDIWDAHNGKLLKKLTGDPETTAAAAAIAFSPDGKRLYTVSHRGNVVIWDIQSGQALQKIRWHDRYVATATFQPGGSLIALGECARTVEGGLDAQISCEPGEIELWDINSERPLEKPLLGNAAVPTALAFSPDGKYLAAADYEHELLLWDLQTGRSLTLAQTGPIDFPSSLAFSSDSSFIAVGDSTNLVSFLSVPDGKTVHPLIRLTHDLSALQLTSDSKTLITSSYTRNSDASDEVAFWDVQSGDPIGAPLSGYTAYLGNLVISPDGSTLAAGGVPVYLWDARNAEPLAAQPSAGSKDEPLAFSPDGGRLVTGGYLSSTLTLWDARQKTVITAIQDLPDNIDAAKFSPDGETFYSFSPKGGLGQWDGHTGAPIQTLLNDYTDNLYQAVFSPNGQWFVTTAGTTIHLWESGSGSLRSSFASGLGGIASMAFSPDSRLIAVGGCAGSGSPQCAQGQLVLFDVEASSEITRLTTGLPANAVREMAFSPDGGSLAIASDFVIQLWDLFPSAQLVRSVELKDMPAMKDYRLPPTLLAFSPDGTSLAVGQQFPSTLAFLSVSDLKLIADPVPAAGNLLSLAFTPDGKGLIAGSDVPYSIPLDRQPLQAIPFLSLDQVTLDDLVSSVAVSPDGRTLATGTESAYIDVWNISGGEPVKKFTLNGHSDQIRALAFSPDGQTLYSASQDMTLDRWDLSTGHLIDQPIQGYRDNSRTRGAFSPDGKTLATSGCRIKSDHKNCSEAEIDLWDVASGKPLMDFHPGYQVFSLAFSPDGRTLVDSSADKRNSVVQKGSVEIHLWDLTAHPPTPKTLVQGLDDLFDQVVFTPDGTRLMGRHSNALVAFDATTGAPLALPTSITSRYYNGLAFTTDGKTMALGTGTGIQLVDLEQDQLIGPLLSDLAPGYAMTNSMMQFSPEGTTLVGGGPLTFWNVDLTAWIAHACDISDRNLSEEEWKTYLGDDPFQKTCPNIP